MTSTGERMVLRAELVRGATSVVGHTTELTARTMFVRTDEPFAVGEAVTVRLSFPRLLPLIELEAHVTSIDPGLGHGYAPGVTLGFPEGSAGHARLVRLFGSLDGLAVAGPYRILVVEDSPLMRDFMQLGAERFTVGALQVVVDTVDTAEVALEQLRTVRYELLLADLYLPGVIDGATLVREVRAAEADLPVIGFSVGGAAARAAFLAAGADLFLDKPVMVKDVFATIERLRLMHARRSA